MVLPVTDNVPEILPVIIVVILAVVIVAVVICAILAVSVFVTFALLNVVLPVTNKVLPTLIEPFALISSKPIVSSTMLPDTVRLPEIVVSPTTLRVLPTTRLVLA